MRNLPAIALAALLASAPPLVAKPFQIVADSGRLVPAYADIASLVLASPVVLVATIRNAQKLSAQDAAGIPPGVQRYYITADVSALLRGDSALPVRVNYVLDVPVSPNQRPPRLGRMRVMLFARSVPGQLGQLQLVAQDGQRAWTPELEPLARRIVAEVLAPDAPPAVTGVANAFYVPASLPGEGQTQIFLSTEQGQPVSLLIDHRNGQPPRWSVSFSDLVDQASPPPARDTLAWYRLACALPPMLPPESIAGDDAAAARIAGTDYALVLGDLGPCTGKRD